MLERLITFIVLGFFVFVADFGSWWVGPAGRSSTIQDLDAPPFMRFFFSVMQFHATTGCLLGVRRFATQFFYVWIIRARATHTRRTPHACRARAPTRRARGRRCLRIGEAVCVFVVARPFD